MKTVVIPEKLNPQQDHTVQQDPKPQADPNLQADAIDKNVLDQKRNESVVYYISNFRMQKSKSWRAS